MLEVPPASISPKPNLTLSLTHTHTHALTHLDSHHIIFLMQGHLTAAAYGGRPRPGPTNQPTNQQQPSVARRIAGHNSAPCQLLCGVFSSPCSSLSYFWGDNFSKHVALQVHVIWPQKADLPRECFWIEKNVGSPLISNYRSDSITLSMVSSVFSTTCRGFFYVKLRSPLLCLDQ